MPTARLLGKCEFKAFAAQRALIDDCEVPPDRVDKPAGCAARKARLGFAEIKDPIQVAPPKLAISDVDNDAHAPPSG
jgi:hypothetical protein